MRASVLRAATVALALASVACGVRTDDEPQEISEDNVPEDLHDDDVTSAAGSDTADTEEPGQPVTVWFLETVEGEEQLKDVQRTVPRPPTDKGILEALLLEPPDESERAFGITTAIPSSTTLAGAPEREGDGVLVINLTEGIYDVQSDELVNAYAQVVCTATEIPGIRAVRFEVEGAPAGGLDGNGQVPNGPLACESYARLLPETLDAGREQVTLPGHE